MRARSCWRGCGRRWVPRRAAPPPIPRAYRQAGRAADPDALVERFCERVADYRARVHRATAASLDDVVAGLLAGRRVLVPAAPPCDVRGCEALGDDPPLTARELDAADATLTGCALAVAETGTIVLDGSAACGRRALTLVPDHHVCVVRAEQIVADVPDAIAALRRGRHAPADHARLGPLRDLGHRARARRGRARPARARRRRGRLTDGLRQCVVRPQRAWIVVPCTRTMR